MRLLVVGQDGILGGALAQALAINGHQVTGTSRRGYCKGIPLDLETTNFTAAFHRAPFDAAIVCAGITKLSACAADPELTRKINVTRLIELTHVLVNAGVFVVHLSTNLVFDGMRSSPAEGDRVSPVTVYGRQKAELEAAIANTWAGDTAIIRLTKVFHPRHALVSDWREKLKCGNPIEAFSDRTCSPLRLDEAVTAIAAVALRRSPGIWHFSNDDNITFVELARDIAANLGVPDHVVRAVRSPEAEAHSERPRFAALGHARAHSVGLEFSTASNVTRYLVEQDLSARTKCSAVI